MKSILLGMLLMLFVALPLSANQASVHKNKISTHKSSRQPASTANNRFPANSANEPCEELRKTSIKCNQVLESFFDGREDQNKKSIRQFQNQILASRRTLAEQKKECDHLALSEKCFDEVAAIWSKQSHRSPNAKIDHRQELLGIGNELLLKINGQAGRSPAANP